MNARVVLVIANIALIVIGLFFLGSLAVNWAVSAHYHPDLATWGRFGRAAGQHAIFLGPPFAFALLARILARRDLKDPRQ